jgi:hypothetical protein
MTTSRQIGSGEPPGRRRHQTPASQSKLNDIGHYRTDVVETG